jgi:hypothetical protein
MAAGHRSPVWSRTLVVRYQVLEQRRGLVSRSGLSRGGTIGLLTRSGWAPQSGGACACRQRSWSSMRGLPCSDLRCPSGRQEPPVPPGVGTILHRPCALKWWTWLLTGRACLFCYLPVPSPTHRYACVRSAGCPLSEGLVPEGSGAGADRGLALPSCSCPDLACRDRLVVSGWAPHLRVLYPRAAEPGLREGGLPPSADRCLPADRRLRSWAGHCTDRSRAGLLQSRE